MQLLYDNNEKFPQKYLFDVGNICNLHCKYCGTGQGAYKKRDHLVTRDEFDIVFNKIYKYASEIQLFNLGEPFLNKNLLYMITKCTDKDIYTSFHSNLCAFEFSDEFAEQIVRSGLKTLIISADGSTQSEYEKYRIGGKLDLVFYNIEKIKQAKKRLMKKTPYLVWKYLIWRENEKGVLKAVSIAKDININIIFGLLESPCPEQDASLQFATINNLPKPFIIDPEVNEFESKWSVFQSSVEDLRLHKELRMECTQPFGVGIIDPYGNMKPCCCIPSEREYFIGNIYKQSLEEIWFGAKMQSCRQYLKNFPKNEFNKFSVCGNVSCPINKINLKKKIVITLEEFIKSNELHKLNIAVWGTGGRYHNIIKNILLEYNIKFIYFIDSYKENNEYINNIECISPEKIKYSSIDIIIIASCFVKEISNTLDMLKYDGIIVIQD